MPRSRRRASTSRCASDGRRSRRPRTARAAGALAYAGDDTTRALLRRSAELDAIQLALLAEVADARHRSRRWSTCRASTSRSTRCSVSDQAGLAASTLAARLDALKAYYVDARSTARAVPDAGRRRARHRRHRARPRRRERRGTPVGARRGACERTTSARAPPTAVAPTVLYALGIPIGRDLPSAPLLELFDPQFTRSLSRAPGRDLRPAVDRAAVARRTAARSGDDRSAAGAWVCEVSWRQELHR